MRLKSWQLALIILAALGIAGVLYVWSIHRRAVAVIRRHEREAVERLRALQQGDSRRPSIYGQALPGNAWPLYEQVVKEIDRMPQADMDAIPEMREENPDHPNDGRIAALLSQYAPEIETLRRALRLDSVMPPDLEDRAMALKSPYSSEALKACKFLAGGAGWLHRRGRDAEALELIALDLGMSADLERYGAVIDAMIDRVCEVICGMEVQTILKEHSLRPQDLRAFAGTLDGLERSRPRLAQALEMETLGMRLRLARSVGFEGKDYFLTESLPLWKYGFSTKAFLAQALNEMVDRLEDLQGVEKLPAQERLKAARNLAANLAMNRNLLVGRLFPAYAKVFESYARAETMRLLARVAVALALFELEREARPSRLELLVPDYLPIVPVAPLSGQPLGYHDGTVWSFDPESGGAAGKAVPEGQEPPPGEFVWTIRRK